MYLKLSAERRYRHLQRLLRALSAAEVSALTVYRGLSRGIKVKVAPEIAVETVLEALVIVNPFTVNTASFAA
jgi:hypothetical protein